jgi:Flp pilus assembly protein CpaB
VSSRRTLILIGAIVIGGLAAFLTLNYTKGVENENAEANQLVEVLVAATPIAKGTSADEAIATEMVVTDQRRRADLPTAYVTREAEIAGQVASVDLGGGEIITPMMFVADDAISGSNGTTLDKGNVAITINADGAAGVAGLIQPGDSINILARASVSEEGAASDASSASRAAPADPGGEAWTLPGPYVAAFQDVKVLAVGTNLGEPVATAEGEAAPAAPAASGMITVQLPPDQAVLLASVKDAALHLTLNRPDYEPVPLPFFNKVPAFGGELGVSPYPEQPAETDGQ